MSHRRGLVVAFQAYLRSYRLLPRITPLSKDSEGAILRGRQAGALVNLAALAARSRIRWEDSDGEAIERRAAR